MLTDYPETHQDLLEFAIRARRFVLGETSGNISGEGWELKRWAMKYAAAHGLIAPEGLEDYGICDYD